MNERRRRRYDFKPALVPTVAAIVLTGLFITLGVWQLNRAQEKQAMLSRYEALGQRRPVELQLPVMNEARWRYRNVRLTGRFDREHQFLLDNQVYRGRVGYNVLTLLQPIGAEQRVLIDRGWIPAGTSRGQLPRIPVTARRVTIQGEVYVPYEDGYRLGGMDTGEHGWPRRIQFIDFEQIARRATAPLARMIVRLNPASPHGYVRDWQIVPFSPQRHLGYAFQWFALAVGMLVIFIVVNTNRKTETA
jgi:surfeit locus 1 family protein